MIAVVATLIAKEGHEAQLEAVAGELAAKVRANEPGCLLYILCKADAPRTYMFLERYQDQTAIEAHRKTEHFRTLGRQLGEHLDGPPTISRLTVVA